MYHSIIEPTLEMVSFLNLQKRILIVLNKIDHPSIEYNHDHYKKAEKFLRMELERNYLDSREIPFVRISALKNENIVGTIDEEQLCFFEELLHLSKNVLPVRTPLVQKSLPLRISILKKHKILGSGIVVQGMVLSGEVKKDDDILILPTFFKTKVKSLEIFNVSHESASVSSIVGLSLANVRFEDLKHGYVLTKPDCSSYPSWDFNGASLKAYFTKTFNGVYPGYFLTLIGFNIKLSCFIKDISQKIDFGSPDP